MIPTLLLLGATGDLARRYLLPALGALEEAGRLPNVTVVGFLAMVGARTLAGGEAGNDVVGDA